MARPRGDAAAGAPPARARVPASTLLPLTIFWSTLDRSLILPLIPGIAGDLGTSVAVSAVAITTHAAAYALLQILWGPLSTRWGRIRVLVVSTALAAAANALAAMSPDIVMLIIARTASGGAFAATFAAVLTYFGDALPLARRPSAMSNLATATALGLAIGTLASGALATWVSWRAIFAVYAVATALMALMLATLPEVGERGVEGIRPQIMRLVRNRWAIAVCAVTALEGLLLIGVFNLLPVVLQQAGSDVFTAGMATAAFGVAVVAVSQLMKLVVARVPATWFFVAGGCTAVLGFLILAMRVDPLTVLIGATCLGVAWALAHTTLQTWMTDAASDTRALGMTLFSISLMLGAAVGSAAGTVAVDQGAFSVLFIGSAVAALGFGVVAVAMRRRYRERGD